MTAPESEGTYVAPTIPASTNESEQNFRQKCLDLKNRIIEVEGNNEIATLALSRTKAAIRRARLEYVILLERLEDRAVQIPNGIGGFEEMASPPVPSVLDETLKVGKPGLIKKTVKKQKPSPLASNPPIKVEPPRDSPKGPTDAFLTFCEAQKHSFRTDPPLSAADLAKAMSEAWKNLNATDRLPYYKAFEDEKKRYAKEMETYNKKSEEENTETEDESPFKKIKLEAVVGDVTPEPNEDYNITSEPVESDEDEEE